MFLAHSVSFHLLQHLMIVLRISKNIFIFGSLFFGVGVTSRQIYIQNLSSEGLTNLSGCGMPLETTIEFYGFLEVFIELFKGVLAVQKKVGDLSLILLNGA